MNWLIYLAIILAPLITWSQAMDPFWVKTMMVMILGLSFLAYWLTRDHLNWNGFPLFYGWALITYLACAWKLGNPAIEMLQLTAYLGIYLYAKDNLTPEQVIPALMISLAVTIGYTYYLDRITIKDMIGAMALRRTIWGAPTFISPRLYGGWLVLLIPIALARAVQGKWIGWILFAAGIMAIWTTGGRSSMLGLTAALAVFSAFYWGRKGMAGAVAIIGLFMAIGWLSFAHQTIDPSRAHFWRGVIPQMESRKLTGYGIGSFRTVYPIYKENRNEGADPTHLLENVHNEYFQQITETGIIGLGLFLLMVYKAFKKANKMRAINIAMIAGVFGCLVDNFYNVSLRYSAIGMIFWLYLGLLTGSQREEIKHEHKTWIQRLSEWADYCFYN
jgi:O-antigen ligase